MFDIYSS